MERHFVSWSDSGDNLVCWLVLLTVLMITPLSAQDTIAASSG